jgi:hypothetical protein
MDFQEIFYKNDDKWILNDFENAKHHLTNAEKNNFNGHATTYSYTKRLTETIANEEFKRLPICLVRPSIGMNEKFCFTHFTIKAYLKPFYS